MGIDRELDFAQHLLGAVRGTRKDQEHHFGLLDGARDFSRKRFSRAHIPGRDPAGDPALLERRANCLRGLLVLGGVRNENVARHERRRRFYLLRRDPATELMAARMAGSTKALANNFQAD